MVKFFMVYYCIWGVGPWAGAAIRGDLLPLASQMPPALNRPHKLNIFNDPIYGFIRIPEGLVFAVIWSTPGRTIHAFTMPWARCT